MEVLGLIANMPTKIEVDSEWFFIPKAWLDKWEAWCYVDIINAAKSGEEDLNDEIRQAERANPGRICFSALFENKEKNMIVEQALKFKWQNYQVKKGLREGVDFILVTKEVFDSLVSKYRSEEENPEQCFKRYGVEQDDGEVVCEMRFRKINFFALPNKSTYKMKHYYCCFVPKSYLVLELEKKLLRAINYYMHTVRQERGIMTVKCRLWKTSVTEMT